MNKEHAQPYLVQLTGIEKRYPGVRALQGVDFDLRAGEIHALAGENGAGKSTLMKVLGGVILPDEGEVRIRGELTRLSGPRDALKMGISLVHQELVTTPMLSVTENILLGRLPSKLGRVDWSGAHKHARELLDRLGLRISERTQMARLSLGQQQLVEIARALSRESAVLVLDEPSAILGQTELETLYRVVRNLRDEGVGIVYISHRLSEVLALTDRVTVLKDGQLQKTVASADLDQEQLVTLMTGRDLTIPPKTSPAEDAPILLSVEDLHVRGAAEPVSFTVRAGEVLGVAGLVGSGRTEVARAIIGADPARGLVSVRGKQMRRRTPRSTRRKGVAYLPEDRKDQGLLLNRSIHENIGLASLGRRSRWGILRRKWDESDVERHATAVGMKAPNLRAKAGTLSGGNQQKVMLARWLAAEPSVLILDEPTRGIDVGSKSEIYQLIHQVAESGRAVVLISSELEEILSMSNRVLVMRDRRIAAELATGEISEQAVTRAAIVGGNPAADATDPQTRAFESTPQERP